MLFGASAAVVLWQSGRVKVLSDFTYVIEIAYRVALGDVPYRDFVIPQAPLTFLIQSAILKLADSSLWPHVWYCALAAGATAVLTYRIARDQLSARVGSAAALIAFGFSAPLVFLNGYAILSHAFYDSDCVLLILLVVALVLSARRRHYAWWRYSLAGFLLALAPVTKQNIGVAAFVVIHAGLIASALAQPAGTERRAYVSFLAGSIAGLLVIAMTIQAAVGLRTYYQWTVSYAATRRFPSVELVVSFYRRPRTWITVACGLSGYLVVRLRARSWWPVPLGLAIIALPLIDATHTMLRWGLAARAFCVWGLAAVGTVCVSVGHLRQRDWGFERMVPLATVVVAHAAFASQGVYDSSYSVWPFLMIPLAALAARLLEATADRQRWITAAFVGLVTGVSVWVGYLHVAREERLRFADLSGPVEHASLPALKGLATPGSYLSDFEYLVRRSEQLIPREDGIVLVPGEDPFFFATKRRPRFPLILFDDTAVPYDTMTLMQMLQQRDIKWVIVKTRLQLLNNPWTPLASFVSTDLPSRYSVVEEIPRYTILRLRPAAVEGRQ